jgi:hypothetical protein
MTKKSGSITVSLFKIVFGFLGAGVIIASLYALLASFAGTTELRSQAGFIGEADQMLLNHPCNSAFKPAIGCAAGYHCVETNRRTDMERRGRAVSFARWGRCQPDTAPTPLPTVVVTPVTPCWSRVFELNGNLSWPDACRGAMPKTDASGNESFSCAEVITPLAPTELAAYKAWVAGGKQHIPECPDGR